MFETIAQLVSLMQRTPAAVIDTTAWCWQHPAAVIALGMCSLAFGGFCYVSTLFHRPKGN